MIRTLEVQGMTCMGCAGRVERALAKVPGVAKASVNLATERATIVGDADPAALVTAVGEAGYQASEKKPTEKPKLDSDVVLAVVLTVPLVVFSMVPMLLNVASGWAHVFMGWPGLALAAPIQLWAGRRFYRQGWSEIRQRSLGMSTLVMLGSSAAFFYSLAVLVVPLPGGTYFEASASIVTFILVGKALEARAKKSASSAMEKLLALGAKEARVRRGDEVVEVPIGEVAMGDLVIVRPGDRVAVDGVVVEGSSFVDESMVTGEPMPRERGLSDPVVGGTINGEGALVIRATRVGEASFLAQIVRSVEEAQGSKSKVQELADRVAAYFVPAVVVVSAITFAAWMLAGAAFSFALVAAVSVLVVACPCAMGLATPAAVMVASGRAASMGIVFRKGSAIEELARAKIVLFDKTGTLTEGKPKVVAAHAFRPDALRFAAAVESMSEHPLARAVVAYVAADGITATDVKVEPGRGLRGTVEGHEVRVGSPDHLPLAPPELLQAMTGTPIVVSIDGELGAVIEVADAVRETTRAAVTDVRALGMQVEMVTGDTLRTAEQIGRAVGIDVVHAGQKPSDKRREVQKHERVAFVGDGLNDAPALAQASVGVAMGGGTDVAAEAGDVLLVRQDLSAFVDAVRLSRRTMRIIRENFFWAAIYNVALVPLAAGVFHSRFHIMLSPALAAAAMSASSLFVIGNSLRLRARM